jgi:hypothetical protein
VLHDRHPATGRDVYSTDDPDVPLHNAMRPNPPSMVGNMIIFHGLLKEKVDR